MRMLTCAALVGAFATLLSLAAALPVEANEANDCVSVNNAGRYPDIYNKCGQQIRVFFSGGSCAGGASNLCAWTIQPYGSSGPMAGLANGRLVAACYGRKHFANGRCS